VAESLCVKFQLPLQASHSEVSYCAAMTGQTMGQ